MRATKNKRYFTQETEDAIIQYNKSTNDEERNLIFSTKINKVFYKLTENLIHTYKFYNTEVENLGDVQHEVIIFLLSKIHRYNHRQNIQDRLTKIIKKEFNEEFDGDFLEYVGEVDKVTQEQIDTFIDKLEHLSPECLVKIRKMTPPKAYSYFGTIAKNFLIFTNKKIYDKKIISNSIEEIEEDEKYSYDMIEVDSPKDKLSFFTDKFIQYCTNNITELFPKPYDAKIADVILELFRKRENIDIFNKKALYIYIREMIDVKTLKITQISKKLKLIFQNNYIHYLDTGYINFK